MSPGLDYMVAQRAAVLLQEHRQRIWRRTDRLFAGLMLLQWIAAICAAYWLSPLTWAGRLGTTHLHVWAAWFLGGAISLFPMGLAMLRPGRATTRYVVASGQVLMSALLIHLSGGRIETHFHVFGSLAFLAFYRDWTVFIPAVTLVSADHFLRGLYWPASVYGVLTAGSWRWLEHAAWVLFETTFLIHSCLQSLQEMRDIAWQRAELEVVNEKTEQTVVVRTTELKASEERFRSLSAASPIGIFETDPRGQVVYVNARWAEIAGVPVGSALGDGWIETIHPADRESAIEDWTAAVGAGRESNRELRMLTPQGAVRWVSARTKPLVSDQGGVTGHVGTVEDITVRKHAEVELAEARDRALEMARIKSEFLANVSHEIRTPMHAIIGMTDMALDSELPPEPRECLETVGVSARALLALLNDILDLSKMEVGRLELETISFSLRDTLAETLRTLAVRAHQKGLELACDVSPEVPDAMLGDPARLRQLILNIAGNAIKFTDRGEVVVRVWPEPGTTERHAVLHFAVSDTGIGIPEDKRASIFEPFVQADGSMSRRYGGTGLGLSIALQLVEMMGGRIWVESEIGTGSTFHVTARFGLEADTRTPRVESTGLQDLPALVVDDNATSREILVRMLQGWKVRATAASDASEALAALKRAKQDGHPIRLALVDAHMPGTDGPTLANLIHKDPELADTSVILLSSVGLPLQRSDDLKTVLCLKKPIARSHLLEAIQAVRGQHVMRDAGPLPIARALRPLKVLVAEDKAVNRKVAVRMLEKRGHTVCAVEDGQEALEALERERFDVVLMDVQMPRLDGLRATAAIRATEATTGGAHTPVVALTAHAMAGDRERCLEAGMDAYVSKPVEAAELIEAIERVVGRTGDQRATRPRPPDTTDVVDHAGMMRRVDHDPQLLLELVSAFRNESAEILGEIRQSIARRDAEALKRSAHALKGVLKTMAAPAAAEAALELEMMAREGDFARVGGGWRVLEGEMRRLQAELSSLVSAGA